MTGILKFTRILLVLLAYAPEGRAAGLSLKHLRVEKIEDGPAVLRPDGFQPGETVYFSFFVEGCARKNDQVEVSFEAQPNDPSGISLTPPLTGSNKGALSPEDKEWMPKLRGNFVLPAVLEPGKYRIDLHVTDAIAGNFVYKDLEFRVEGPAVAQGTEFAIKDFQFLRNEEDMRPMPVAAYLLSEEVHAHFVIVGYKHGAQGAIDVTYGISVTDAQGRVLFGEAAAAHDTTADFYPKPYVPGVLSFTLSPGTPAGEFTLTVTAQDAIGGQKTEASRKFRME